MLFLFEPIKYSEVLEIEGWRYSGFEKRVYMDRYHESMKRGDSPLRGPRGSHGYAVYSEDRILFGLMEFYFEESGVFLGLAISPLFVGRGHSSDFIHQGIDFLDLHYPEHKPVKIEVHRKNIQGLKSYEKAGFKLKSRDGDILLFVEPDNKP